MPFVDNAVKLLVDAKRMLETRDGAYRLALCRTYLRLKLLRNAGGSAQVDVLGYHVHYLDAANLLQLFREIFVDRLYDVSLASDSPTIVDCGSNIGMSVLFFKKAYPSARIIGFEPEPIAFAALRGNIESNRLSDVVVLEKALSSEASRVQLLRVPGRPGALHAGLFTGGRTEAVTVEAVRLSDHIEGVVDLLKLDVEGAEEMILHDLARSDKLRHVRNIVCEYHHHLKRQSKDDHLATVLGILEREGFRYQLKAYAERPWRIGLQEILIYARRD